MSLANIVKFHKEPKRRKAHRQTLLSYLETNGSITTTELWKFGGTGASSRLHELRQAGYIILKAEYIKPGIYRYQYRGRK